MSGDEYNRWHAIRADFVVKHMDLTRNDGAYLSPGFGNSRAETAGRMGGTRQHARQWDSGHLGKSDQ